MATGSELSNPRVFRWGLCGYKVFLDSDCVIAHAKGHAPPKSSGVLLLVVDLARVYRERFQTEGR